MPFFRRPQDLTHAIARPAVSDDITAVSRLLRESAHRFLGTASAELPALIGTAPACLLFRGGDVWGAAVAGWPVDDTSWVRALALADGVATGEGVDALLSQLFDQLHGQGVQRLFYAGDVGADAWIQPLLLDRGWQHHTDVVVYEKIGYAVPDSGNAQVRVRQAQPADLRAILALDRLSFDAQWVKDGSVIAPAIVEQPFFVVAEQAGLPVGYAFATGHFNGRLMHLVRIAVDPAARGQGIGVRLMAEVVGYARQSNADSLTLNTQQENRAAQRLYEWFGFRRTGESQRVLRRDLAGVA
ncbi:MAG: GNAT family N-acetyltransferase [Roseiflexaceae bacterium]|nr:GNAT family N-acetyltransferase [Roseiflexaceae bacterium]